jgi:hypothetical protein
MNGLKQLREILDQTVVVRFPRHRLATFGDSDIQYHLVTPHPDSADRSTLRSGRISALRPKILTSESLRRHFEGFGDDADGFERLLKDHFADSFQGLEYVFHNRLASVEDRHANALDLAKTLGRDLDDRSATREAVIRGPAGGWTLSLMKFTLEEAGRSFPVNMRELDEHNLFDPAAVALGRRKGEIERLFREAASSSGQRPLLAAKLKEYGLFDEYQDRFFHLVKNIRA